MEKAPKRNPTKNEGQADLSKEHNSFDSRPTITFTEKELPEITSWQVGGEYDIVIHVKQLHSNTSDAGHSASFQVLSAKAEGTPEYDSEAGELPAEQQSESVTE